APGGIYSSLLARVEKYRFAGKATTDVEREARIEEEPGELDLTVSLPDVALSSGGLTEIVVTVSLDGPVLVVDWDLVTPDAEGKLVVGQSSSQIAAVRDEVRAAFSVSSVR
ncbi:MAG TPA: hypothetical protein VFU21_05205, partial [Kofleriaceae bacterium]|nr:hypothetical protein [Kofleriaceae bacterium]